MDSLELQRIAVAPFLEPGVPAASLTPHSVEEDGDLDGDTLALFVWREVGDAHGDPEEAVRMIRFAQEQLERVVADLEAVEPVGTFDQTQALAEGWCLMNGRNIQRCDEVLRFTNDAEAELFVHHQAQLGSAYHAQAIRQTAAHDRG